MTELGHARVLIVGLGGLGSPAALILARSGVGHLTLVDDDVVDRSNLHRQTLYTEADDGRPKTQVAAERLQRESDATIETIPGRLLPHNAVERIAAHDLVLEGADNFASKFLTADAAALAARPVVQAGAVRWYGWALGARPKSSACMRCVFEDIPRDRVETCAEAGVVGPVVGVMGALQAALAIRLLQGDDSAAGELWSYDALAGRLRRTRVSRRVDCPLCRAQIRDINIDRYVGPVCSS